MDANTIIRLLDAGYTKEEISAMETVPVQTPAVETPAPTPAPVQIPVVDGNPDPYPAPVVAEAPVAIAEPTPAPAPTPAPEQPSLSDVMHQIAKLTASIQANALANTNIPNSADPRGGLTGENALAEIIRPTFGGGKNV